MAGDARHGGPAPLKLTWDTPAKYMPASQTGSWLRHWHGVRLRRPVSRPDPTRLSRTPTAPLRPSAVDSTAAPACQHTLAGGSACKLCTSAPTRAYDRGCHSTCASTCNLHLATMEHARCPACAAQCAAKPLLASPQTLAQRRQRSCCGTGVATGGDTDHACKAHPRWCMRARSHSSTKRSRWLAALVKMVSSPL